jgi:hypothetical protein
MVVSGSEMSRSARPDWIRIPEPLLTTNPRAQWFQKPPIHIPYIVVQSNHSSVVKIYL